MGLADIVGRELGPTDWLDVTQARVDAFAAATDDPQWIHVDPVRAAAGPFGTTVAHGFLTLSLCIPLVVPLLPRPGYRLGLNYGVDRVRFPAPVLVPARIRARFRVHAVEPTEAGDRVRLTATVEQEGGETPVCVAELVFLYVP